MTLVTVRRRDGTTQSLDWTGAGSLMEALRDAGHDVAGTCGGSCSCGTCHVYVDADAVAGLVAASEDERDMLDALADVVAVTPCSRLACQLRCDGRAALAIEIAPQP
ncbi:MAG: 2Fe-2S iron-sulfur cluster binding domain-containing protein [Sandarakinorhabdus sp.]|nr:2Fe-2S iron-sulfur cluster binding domain-containing protein [Sandarakinorhabdus sp.]